MIKLQIKASSTYPVYVGQDLLSRTGTLLKEEASLPSECRFVLVSDSNVMPLYGAAVTASLKACGFQVAVYNIPAGESSKNWRLLGEFLEFLADSEITRSDCLIALGGGVTGDFTGFAASIYLRGLPFIQIPTTLLAAVDSSVGGKTAVDLKAGKNLAGTFWQPKAVICDTNTFSTLPETVYLDGVAESLKYGILKDRVLFEEIKNGGLKENTSKLISQCISMKGEIVASDEFDKGTRELLNLGHTFGHALETLSHYTISHGHAVASGMHMAGCYAEKLGLCSSSCRDEITSALTGLGFSLNCLYTGKDMYQVMRKDKKRKGDSIHLILPYSIGDCRIYPLSLKSLETLMT